MWILPKNLPLSNSATVTEGLESGLKEQSQICAASLLVRSKPSPVQIWLRKWKRDSWTHHLYGRILKLSQAKAFTDEWASLWGVIPVLLSAPQDSEREKTTPGTSGPISGTQLELFAPESASSKTSKDTLPLGSATSCKTWASWVTERRGTYSARLKLARLTSEKESSSWPTASARDWKDSSGMSQQGVNPDGSPRKRIDQLARAVYGLPDPENLNTDGNRPGQWGTPRVTTNGGTPCPDSTGRGSRLEDQVAMNWPTPNTTPDAPNGSLNRGNGQIRARNKSQCLGELAKQWSTASVCGNHNRKGAIQNSGDGLSTAAKQWATPRAEMDSGKHRGKPDTLHSQIKTWPSPHANSSTGTGSEGRQVGENIQTAVGGRLNPRWVETLMNLPIGWTMPSCASPVTIERTN